MALNQLIQLGQLNRLRSSIRFPGNSALNITAPFMTKAGIRYTQTGDGVVHLPAMVGTVPSLEPYVMVEIAAALLKTLGLAAAFQAQQQINSFLGQAIVRPDTTSGLIQYQLQNITIVNPREQSFAGDDASYPLLLRGYFPINASIYS